MAKLLISLALLVGLCASQSSRLLEKPLNLVGLQYNGGDPLLNPPTRTAGYFKLNRTHDAHLFYFFFESREDPQNDPLVLWMTGGPGCSSELAVFVENGPFHIGDDLSLFESQYGWDVSHNMIYIDQPVNTGFSYSSDARDTVTSEKIVAEDMYEFLQEFLQAHPKFQQSQFFVTGESYAGHYVPAVSHRIFQANLENEGPISINLQGFTIGDGLTDPGIQYGAYADYAYLNGLITADERDRVSRSYPSCKEAIKQCNGLDWKYECLMALQYCQTAIFQRLLGMIGNINYYDIREQCLMPPLCYNFTKISTYINQPEILEELGVGDCRWQACNQRVHFAMLGDWMKDLEKVIPPMLEAGIRVNIYAGDKDLVCNWLGNRRWVDAMQWNRSSEWAQVEDAQWSVTGNEAAGTVATIGPLQFTKVYNAGHLAPMDQPENCYYMIKQFTRNKPLVPSTNKQQLVAEL